MELLIAANRALAIKYATVQGWTPMRGPALVWDRGGGVIVRYVDCPSALSGWPRGTRFHEAPGTNGSDVWATANRLTVLGLLAPY